MPNQANDAAIAAAIAAEIAQAAATATAQAQEARPRLPLVPTKAIFQNHCRYYASGGYCAKKSECRFLHDPNERMKWVTDDDRLGRNP